MFMRFGIFDLHIFDRVMTLFDVESPFAELVSATLATFLSDSFEILQIFLLCTWYVHLNFWFNHFWLSYGLVLLRIFIFKAWAQTTHWTARLHRKYHRTSTSASRKTGSYPYNLSSPISRGIPNSLYRPLFDMGLSRTVNITRVFSFKLLKFTTLSIFLTYQAGM